MDYNLIAKSQGAFEGFKGLGDFDLTIQAGRTEEAKEKSKLLLKNATNTDFGYKRTIDTLTQIRTEIVEQKFFTVQPSEFLPVKVGFGAWSQTLMTYRAFQVADDFASGDVDVANNSRINEADIAIDTVSVKVKNWAKQLGYSLIDINQAMVSGNWSLVEEKEKSRKRNWDLGIQKIAFLGHPTDTNVLGLLNQGTVTEDTITIPTSLTEMTDTEFQTFMGSFLKVYYSNSAATALPDMFVIPTSDFLGLGQSAAQNFAGVGKTKLEYLEAEFKRMTGNPNAQVKPVIYADKNFNSLGKNVYALYKNEAEAIEMNIPVSYTSTIAGSYNNFQFQSIAYGQYTGVQLYRDKQVLYFTNTTTI